MRVWARLGELVPEDDWHAEGERRLIPLPVLRRLRAGEPVAYDEARKRFAFLDGRELPVARRAIAGETDGDRLWRFDQTIYPAEQPLDRAVYVAAAALLPEANWIYEDAGDGGAVGHLSCLPLRPAAYAALRAGEMHEGQLGVADLLAGGPVYLCSMYAAHRSVGAALAADIAGIRGVFGAMAVTEAGKRACLRFDMRVVREDAGQHVDTEIVPVFLERGDNG
ncbi:MAG TPA: hypothetical protein VFQ91_25590 [Bryobacteraceae bacterium]|nr:hypothetical protein [Bryobacteraceae bacterium]